MSQSQDRMESTKDGSSNVDESGMARKDKARRYATIQGVIT